MTQEKYLQVNRTLKRIFKYATGIICGALVCNLIINISAYFIAASDDKFYEGKWNLYTDYFFDCFTTCSFTIGILFLEIGVYYILVSLIKEIQEALSKAKQINN